MSGGGYSGMSAAMSPSSISHPSSGPIPAHPSPGGMPGSPATFPGPGRQKRPGIGRITAGIPSQWNRGYNGR